MNEKYIKQLIRLVEESDIDSLEVSSWGRKVRINKRPSAESNGHGDTSAVVPVASAAPPPAPAAAPPAPAPAPTETPAEPSAPTADNKKKGSLVEVKSPMVGTFYQAPAPDADPYVSVNEKITSGQVVCIVEAMKLMNEIESEVSGRVVEICVENAQPVEFGQTLYVIDTAA
ncbi:acetyl-CoA carboxylase biotin carboxyl carrier protein [candidate division GN15 bacterium]|nr:acetyl-CoA carboxylase biotin carboxyl carrier protein [candidate division GN15 bacterium]